jgi:prevent-host-death family protein
MREWQATEARASWAQFVNAVESGEWQVISKYSRRVVAVRAQDLLELLAPCFSFRPEVLIEDEGYAIWLPELDVYGQGASLEEATADLLDSAREYAEEWEDELRHAPNHRDRAGWVRRVQLAGDDAALCEVLLGSESATLCPT